MQANIFSIQNTASMTTTKTNLTNFTRIQLIEYLASIGLPPSRGNQVFSWLQRPGIVNFHQMIDIKKEVRNLLESHAVINRINTAKIEKSTDGTIKLCFTLEDGAKIESVLIPSADRYTLCLSSQVGCTMGCKFCLTGKMGFTRNLLPSEIVNQVIAALQFMEENGVVRSTPRELINNLVFMGMGEPLANYDNVLNAITILMDQKGLEFTERRIMVSTCGIIPKIHQLGNDVRVNFALSLHAADDKTRNAIMPINKTYPIDALLKACHDYPLTKKKVIFIEYILLEGINDTAQDAKLLSKKLQNLPCRINLLPYNECEALPFKCPPQKTVNQFQTILRQAGFTTIIRNSRGADISAACGQLASYT